MFQGRLQNVENSGTLHRDVVRYIGNGCKACTTVFSNGSSLLGLHYMKQDGDHAEGMVLSSHKEELPLACVFNGVPPSAAGKSRPAPLQEWQRVCFL